METRYKLILASSSPRRKEILSYLEIPFVVESSNCDEISNERDPVKLVLELAELKGKSVFNRQIDDNAFVIAADTIVVCDNTIMGKPKDLIEAKKTLMSLSNRTHQVLTGVSIICKEFNLSFYEKTDVDFYPIAQEELDLYLKTGDSLDKAGAYGIQGQAQFFIKKINGNYSNVVGLPVSKLLLELKKALKVDQIQSLFT